MKRGFHIMTPMFDHGLPTESLVFREGQRSVILWLLDTVEQALSEPDIENPQTYSTERVMDVD